MIDDMNVEVIFVFCLSNIQAMVYAQDKHIPCKNVMLHLTNPYPMIQSKALHRSPRH